MSHKNNSTDFTNKSTNSKSLKHSINKYQIDKVISSDDEQIQSKNNKPKMIQRRISQRKTYFDDNCSDNELNSKIKYDSVTKRKFNSEKTKKVEDIDSDSQKSNKSNSTDNSNKKNVNNDSDNPDVDVESTHTDDSELSYNLDEITVKMGRVKKQTHTLIKIWQERYLWIKQNKMFYTKTNNPDFKFVRPILIVSITNITVSGYGRIFKIDTGLGKSFTFKTGDSYQTEDWVLCLNRSIKYWISKTKKSKKIKVTENYDNQSIVSKKSITDSIVLNKTEDEKRQIEMIDINFPQIIKSNKNNKIKIIDSSNESIDPCDSYNSDCSQKSTHTSIEQELDQTDIDKKTKQTDLQLVRTQNTQGLVLVGNQKPKLKIIDKNMEQILTMPNAKIFFEFRQPIHNKQKLKEEFLEKEKIQEKERKSERVLTWIEKMLISTSDMRDALTESRIRDNIYDINLIINSQEKAPLEKILDFSKGICGKMEINLKEITEIVNEKKRDELYNHQINYFVILLQRIITPFIPKDLPTNNSVNDLSGISMNVLPWNLTLKELLSLIEFYEFFRECVYQVAPEIPLYENYDKIIRISIQSTIDRYINKMKPKIHSLVESIVIKVITEKKVLIEKKIVNKISIKYVKTEGSTDMAILMSEYFSLIKENVSPSLQRKVLSAIISEITFYSREIMLNLLKTYDTEAKTLSLDYICACANDMSILLEQLKYYNSYFENAIKLESDKKKIGEKHVFKSTYSLEKTLNENCNLTEYDILNSMNKSLKPDPEIIKKESIQEIDLEDDLDGIKLDLPRAKDEIYDCGLRIAELVYKTTIKNLEEQLNKLFLNNWFVEYIVDELCSILACYLDNLQITLEPFYFEKTVNFILVNLMEKYCGKFFEILRIKKMFSSNKLTTQKIEKLNEDICKIRNLFQNYISDTEIGLIVRFNMIMLKICSVSSDDIMFMIETELIEYPEYVYPIYLLVDEIIKLRSDFNNKEYELKLKEIRKCIFDNMNKISTDQSDGFEYELSHRIKSEYVIGKILYMLYPNSIYYAKNFLKNVAIEFKIVSSKTSEKNTKSIETLTSTSKQTTNTVNSKYSVDTKNGLSSINFDSFVNSGNIVIVDVDKYESTNKTKNTENNTMNKLKTKILENFDNAIDIATDVIKLKRNRKIRDERRGKKTSTFFD